MSADKSEAQASSQLVCLMFMVLKNNFAIIRNGF